MSQFLRILLVEDSLEDAELLLYQLREDGYVVDCTRVDCEKDFLKCLEEPFDLILSDFQLPQFTGYEALTLRNRLQIQTPFIMVSGNIGEETAVEAMKAGASDYLMKDRLARLGSAVRQTLEKGRLRHQQVEAELARLAAEAKYRTLFENSFEGLFLASQDGRLTLVNPALASMAGFSSTAEMLEKFCWIRDCVSASPMTQQDFFSKLNQFSEVRNFEAELWRRDGTPIWVSADVRVLRDAQGRVYYEGALRDTSERRLAEIALRESEVWFRGLVENAVDIVAVVNESALLEFFSPSTQKILGYKPGEIMGRSLLELIHPEDVSAALRDFQAALLMPSRSITFDCRIQHRDGSWLDFEVSGQNMVDPKGRLRVILNCRDVTETRVLQQQFVQKQKLEAIGTLAGGIAHDFNNILTGIIGYTELAKVQSASLPSLLEDLDAVLGAARRASDLVKQILFFSRRHDQECKLFRLQDVASEVLKLLRASLPTTIEFVVHLEDTTPAILGCGIHSLPIANSADCRSGNPLTADR